MAVFNGGLMSFRFKQINDGFYGDFMLNGIIYFKEGKPDDIISYISRYY